MTLREACMGRYKDCPLPYQLAYLECWRDALRYADDQGWLGHTNECDYRVGVGGMFTKCKCGLEQARKEWGE